MEIEYFKLAREYIEHEDELTHQRLNWALLLQGFLFSAFAAIYAGIFSSQGKFNAEPSRRQYDVVAVFLHCIPIVGYLIAWFSLAGSDAARRAIKVVVGWWKQRPESKHLPLIIGGLDPTTDTLSSWLPIGMPLTLCLIWSFIGSVLLRSDGYSRTALAIIGLGIFLVIRPLLRFIRAEFFRMVSSAGELWCYVRFHKKFWRDLKINTKNAFLEGKCEMCKEPPVGITDAEKDDVVI